MHEAIHRYQLEGELADSNVLEEKEKLIRVLVHQMADDGRVEVLDLEPQFSWEYNADANIFTFKLTMYGAKADNCSAIMAGKKIPITRKSKSKQS